MNTFAQKITKKSILILFGFFILIFLSFSNIVLAATTASLLPTADGGDDTTWVNTSSTVCSTVDCYTEVDETAGGSCTNSDGGTSYIENNNSGASQTFDIDETTIPDGSSITGVDVTACVIRSGASGATYQLRQCINGSCTNSGVDIVPTTLYVETTQSFSISHTKSGSSDLEIGILDTNSARTIRLSQIKAVFTYTASGDTTPPSDTSDLAASGATQTTIDLDWTSPGDDGGTGTATTYDVRYSTAVIDAGNFASASAATGEPSPSVAGNPESMTVTGLTADTPYYFALKTSDEVPNPSGISNVVSLATTFSSVSIPTSGGVSPTYVSFSGQAYPDGRVEVSRNGFLEQIYRSTPLKIYSFLNTGVFNVSYTALLTDRYLFTVKAFDKNNNESRSMYFNIDFNAKNELNVEDLIFSPTINLEKGIVPRGNNLVVEGFAAPNGEVEVFVGDLFQGGAAVNTKGYYTFATSTLLLEGDTHIIKIRQISPEGKKSSFSLNETLKISSILYSKADINNDGGVNISDWSIFLFRWGSLDESLKPSIDINNDSNVDVVDFSLFLESMVI